MERRTFDREKGNVGEGWQQIILDLHRALNKVFGVYQVVQIKEKFGGLRYYIQAPTGAVPEQHQQANSLIDEAEAKSQVTCEVCGKPGETRANGHGWLKTLCNKHHVEYNERINRQRRQMGFKG